MIIAQNDFGTSVFEESTGILHEHFKGRINIDKLSVHFESIDSFLKLNKANASIVNLSKVYGTFGNILELLESSYYPALEKSSIRYQAFILPEDLVIKNLIDKVKKLSLQFSIEIQIFYDKELANSWIQEKLK